MHDMPSTHHKVFGIGLPLSPKRNALIPKNTGISDIQISIIQQHEMISNLRSIIVGLIDPVCTSMHTSITNSEQVAIRPDRRAQHALPVQ